MGVCAAKNKDFDLCIFRETGAFKPPNTEHVTYHFDYRSSEDPLLHLPSDLGKLTPRGICIEPKRKDAGLPLSPGTPARHQGRLPPKWSTVKKDALQPTHMRLCVSGRILLDMPAPGLSGRDSLNCAFAVSTRGVLKTESVKTENFNHEFVTVSSGVVFALFVMIAKGSVFIVPRIVLSLECGDDVILVADDDGMGPLPLPCSYHIDFCVVDDGGRNLQLDVICRGDQDSIALSNDPETPEKRWSLKMCLQEYSAVNNYISPSAISLGNSSIGTEFELATVHLQNLVISEERLDEKKIPSPGPFDVGREVARLRETKQSEKILFEGGDALRIVSSGARANSHPQLSNNARSPRRGAAEADLNASEFWHHIKYEDEDDTSSYEARCDQLGKVITGEFWLSKKAIPEKKNIYFHVSSTLAQALTMCIAFRFNCTKVHMSLISEGHIKSLRHEHIPTNGVIMGLEHDPRNRYLLRMFIEHRNDILDDITVCECWSSLLTQIIAHQEVFDTGSEILYRTTLQYPDGTTLSTVLQTKVDKLEEHYFNSASHNRNAHIIGDPSPRFPITPCNLANKMEVENRIFVYSTVPFQRDDCCADVMSDRGSVGTAVEDFHSVGGYNSDGEADFRQESSPSLLGASGRDVPKDAVPFDVEWRCPVVQSATLLYKVDKPPFACFPNPLP